MHSVAIAFAVGVWIAGLSAVIVRAAAAEMPQALTLPVDVEADQWHLALHRASLCLECD